MAKWCRTYRCWREKTNMRQETIREVNQPVATTTNTPAAAAVFPIEWKSDQTETSRLWRWHVLTHHGVCARNQSESYCVSRKLLKVCRGQNIVSWLKLSGAILLAVFPKVLCFFQTHFPTGNVEMLFFFVLCSDHRCVCCIHLTRPDNWQLLLQLLDSQSWSRSLVFGAFFSQTRWK